MFLYYNIWIPHGYSNLFYVTYRPYRAVKAIKMLGKCWTREYDTKRKLERRLSTINLPGTEKSETCRPWPGTCRGLRQMRVVRSLPSELGRCPLDPRHPIYQTTTQVVQLKWQMSLQLWSERCHFSCEVTDVTSVVKWEMSLQLCYCL